MSSVIWSQLVWDVWTLHMGYKSSVDQLSASVQKKKNEFFNKIIMVILGFDYNFLRRLKKHNLLADDL